MGGFTVILARAMLGDQSVSDEHTRNKFCELLRDTMLGDEAGASLRQTANVLGK